MTGSQAAEAGWQAVPAERIGRRVDGRITVLLVVVIGAHGDVPPPECGRDVPGTLDAAGRLRDAMDPSWSGRGASVMRAYFALMVMVFSLASCAADRDFRARLKAYQADARVAADLARRCANDLRALADRNPLETGRALHDVVAPFVSREWMAPEGTWSEIARRERAFEAIRNTIAFASVDDPAALHRVADAVARGQHIQAGLCRARDVATTLASMARPLRQPALAAGAPSPR